MKKFFILIPSFSMTGPIKGAVALANYLVNEREVHLVTLKKTTDYKAHINQNIKITCLEDHCSSIFQKISFYKKLLKKAGTKETVASISMLFSADFINIFCRNFATTCSSVRGNLTKIYRMDYGFLGLPLAVLHLIYFRKFDKLVTMSQEMEKQVKFYSRRDSTIIGNFIDESELEVYRSNRLKKNINIDFTNFVFVGFVSHRKNPILLLNTLHRLHLDGFNVFLDIIGSGSLMESVKKEIKKLHISEIVKIHGHLENPYKVIAASDIFVLPSFAEGTSRASLEALYLGLPCILRKVDGNMELIEDYKNGFLFLDDDDLYNAMKNAINHASFNSKKDILLPDFYRQSVSSKKFLNYIEHE